MALLTRCPKCGHETRIHDPSLAGRRVRCKKCSAGFTVVLMDVGESQAPMSSESLTGAPSGDSSAGATASIGVSGEWVSERATHLSEQTLNEPRKLPAVDQSGAASEIPENLRQLGLYTLVAKLGEGGMGAVYKATHGKLGTVVAVKVLPEARSILNDDQRIRFEREMRAAGRLVHPNIVRALDAGEHLGMPYLVMELVDGVDLAQHVKATGPLAPAQACGFLLQCARGLEHAHGAQVVHRDIKPSNLVLGKDGVVKVLDLGLARMSDATEDLSLTRTGSVMGTIDFMAPEQALDSKTADVRSDIYSLGCTLYYLLTGQATYSGDTIMKRIMAHRDQPIPGLRKRRPEVSAKLEAAYQRMLAKKPESRFQTMTEVIAALEACDEMKTAGQTEVAPLGSGKTTIIGSLPPRPPASTRLRVIAVAVGLLLVAGLVWPLLAWLTPKPPAVASDPAKTPAISSTALLLTTATTPGQEWNANGLQMPFCWCPPGTFRMGSMQREPKRESNEGPVTVTLTKGFWIGKLEVTQRGWQEVMGVSLAEQRDKTDKSVLLAGVGPPFPMYLVNYDECVEFCRKLTAREKAAGRLPTGWQYRLPTEAQWEYACRAGILAPTVFGRNLGSTQANFNGTLPYNAAPAGPFLQHASLVGKFPANAWGIHDMHGNVQEWCRDAYRDQLLGGNDPDVPTGPGVVVRGGGWESSGDQCRSSARGRRPNLRRTTSLGFRVALIGP